MFCPSCHAEYRPGFDTCSDCGVALVEELPEGSSSEAPGSQDGAVLVWSGNDTRHHAHACSTLERAGIKPHSVSREDRLFTPAEEPRIKVYVAPESAEKAKEVLNESVFSTEEWNDLEQSGAFELPAEDGPDDERPSNYLSDWNPEHATAEIWSGADTDLAEMIVTSLRENQIDCRREAIPAGAENAAGTAKTQGIFVLPEDEARGKDIVREIVDATPL